MPVAQLLGAQRLQLGLLLPQNRLAQRLDCLGNRRLIGGCGHDRGAPPQAHPTECKRARNGQVTTRDTHMLSLPHVLSETLPSPILRRLLCTSTRRVDRTLVDRSHARGGREQASRQFLGRSHGDGCPRQLLTSPGKKGAAPSLDSGPATEGVV